MAAPALGGAPGTTSQLGSSYEATCHAHAREQQHTHDLHEIPEQGPGKSLALWEGPAGSLVTQEGQSVDTPKAHLSAAEGQSVGTQGDREGETEPRGKGREGPCTPRAPWPGLGVPADGLCDGGLALQRRPSGLVVHAGGMGLSRHAHAPQESLAPQGLGDRGVVRRPCRTHPQPTQARAYLQDTGLLCGGCGWDVQLQPGRLLALQTARAIPADLAHGCGPGAEGSVRAHQPCRGAGCLGLPGAESRGTAAPTPGVCPTHPDSPRAVARWSSSAGDTSFSLLQLSDDNTCEGVAPVKSMQDGCLSQPCSWGQETQRWGLQIQGSLRISDHETQSLKGR